MAGCQTQHALNAEQKKFYAQLLLAAGKTGLDIGMLGECANRKVEQMRERNPRRASRP